MRYFFCLLAGLLLIGCDNQDGAVSAKKTAERPVVVLTTYTTPLADRVEALGTAQANESVNIVAKVAATLEQISFSDGQLVRKGTVIARLDRDEELEQLATAEIQLLEHQREIKRLNTLLARHAAATRDLDERQTLAAIATSNIKQIRSRLDDYTISAPFDGKLGMRLVSPGAVLQPGTVITTLDDTDPIKVDFTIPSLALQGIKPGLKIEVSSDAWPVHTFSGAVTAIGSRIDPLTRALFVRAVVANPDGLLIPGMLMRVTILQHQRTALLIPEESVTQREDAHFITLVGSDNTAELRSVQVGTRRDGLVEIVSGLVAGESVVVRGMGFVKQGSRVTISERWDHIRDAQYPQ